MPNTDVGKQPVNVAGYFFQRQLGREGKNTQVALSVAELRARPLMAEIKHLLYQRQYLVSNAHLLTTEETHLLNNIQDKIISWYQLHYNDLYSYAKLDIPCVITYLNEIFRFDNFNECMWLCLNPILSGLHKSLLKMLWNQTGRPEFLSYQYVNLFNNTNKFAKAITLLEKAASLPGKSAMEARTELLMLRLNAL